MKVKNIMFYGFAAAILMGTVSANAATPFKIASQAYVDRQIDNLSGANGAISEVSSAVDTLAGQIAGENETLDDGFTSDTVVGAVNELKDSVGALETTVDTATTGLTARVGALEGTVGTGTMSVGGQSQADVIAAINALDTKTNGIATAGNLSQLETTVGTKQDKSDSTVATLSQGSYNHINAGTGVGLNLVALDTALGTAEGDIDALEAAIGTLPANTNIADALDAKQDDLSQTQLDSITAAANLLAAGYNTCINQSGGSGHCVLSASSGGLEWIDVTSPFQITD